MNHPYSLRAEWHGTAMALMAWIDRWIWHGHLLTSLLSYFCCTYYLPHLETQTWQLQITYLINAQKLKLITWNGMTLPLLKCFPTKLPAQPRYLGPTWMNEALSRYNYLTSYQHQQDGIKLPHTLLLPSPQEMQSLLKPGIPFEGGHYKQKSNPLPSLAFQITYRNTQSFQPYITLLINRLVKWFSGDCYRLLSNLVI